MAAKHKIRIKNGSYFCKYWLELADGGSDQWLYICKDGPLEEGLGFQFFFLEVIDLPAYCGGDATSRWDASVSVVDILNMPPQVIHTAMISCGFDEVFDVKADENRLRIAEWLYQQGSKSPVWNQDGGELTFDSYGNVDKYYDENCPAFKRLRKLGREFFEDELADPIKRNHLLDTKIVNALGQTAREYARGADGLWNTLRGIKAKGDGATKEQQLMLKMYQKAKTTLGAGPVPDDLLE